MIVTVVAYKRPELLARLLESIGKADLTHVTRLIMSCDRHSDEMDQKLYLVFVAILVGSGLPRHIIRQPRRLGIHNHQRWLYNWVTEPDGHADRVVALEEDCVVSPDAFNMAHWALQQPGYKFVNLSHNNLFKGDISGRGKYLVEDNQFRSSYAWAFTRDFWHELEPQWNGKTRQPYGWDWQITYLCYREGWKCLTPEVPRAMNTGREQGTYETPETYDRDRTGVLICQQSPHIYSVVRGNQGSSIVRETPEWVKEEMRP